VSNVTFPTSSSPGAKPGEGSGRLINCYVDKDGDHVAYFRSAGLRAVADTGHSGPRGMLATATALYVAQQDTLVSYSTSGVITTITGALSGARPVTMARNNAAPTPNIAIVTENGAFTITAGAIATWPDFDVGTPVSVSSLDGYFLWVYGTGAIIASDLNSTNINTLSTARAESNPDGLIRGTVSGRQFFAWGQASLEVWDNAGSSPFPLSRAAVVPVGLLSSWAIAGFEDGWDLTQIFVASDGTVRRLNGYQPERISTRAVERDIASVPATDLIRAFVYTSGGNAFWVLTSPIWTWEFNATTSEWNERRSDEMPRWRALTSAKFGGRWLAGDVLSTSLMEITSAALDEAGAPLKAQGEGVLKDFPARMRVPALHFDFTVGQGRESGLDPIESDPTVALSWSHDGGASWSNPLFRRLGRQGNFERQVRIDNLGRSTPHGTRVRWEVSDPVPLQFRGASAVSLTVRRP
jgi:hypothetical protein